MTATTSSLPPFSPWPTWPSGSQSPAWAHGRPPWAVKVIILNRP